MKCNDVIWDTRELHSKLFCAVNWSMQITLWEAFFYGSFDMKNLVLFTSNRIISHVPDPDLNWQLNFKLIFYTFVRNFQKVQITTYGWGLSHTTLISIKCMFLDHFVLFLMNKVKINKSALTGLDVEPTAWNIGQWWNWAKKLHVFRNTNKKTRYSINAESRSKPSVTKPHWHLNRFCASLIKCKTLEEKKNFWSVKEFYTPISYIGQPIRNRFPSRYLPFYKERLLSQQQAGKHLLRRGCCFIFPRKSWSLLFKSCNRSYFRLSLVSAKNAM